MMHIEWFKFLCCREHLFNAIQTMPCVQRKADWALQWINDSESTFGKEGVKYTTLKTEHSEQLWPRGASHLLRVDRSFCFCVLRGATCGFCSCGGHLFLWLVCRHLLAKEERPHAWSYLLQRADQQGRGEMDSHSNTHCLICKMDFFFVVTAAGNISCNLLQAQSLASY